MYFDRICMFSSQRIVFDAKELIKASENPKFADSLKQKINPAKNFIIVTSKTKSDIENNGLDYDYIISNVQEKIGGRIHFAEITTEIKDNAENFKNILSNQPGSDDENIAYCATTKSTLITSDENKKKCCDEIMSGIPVIYGDKIN